MIYPGMPGHRPVGSDPSNGMLMDSQGHGLGLGPNGYPINPNMMQAPSDGYHPHDFRQQGKLIQLLVWVIVAGLIVC